MVKQIHFQKRVLIMLVMKLAYVSTLSLKYLNKIQNASQETHELLKCFSFIIIFIIKYHLQFNKKIIYGFAVYG